MPKNIVLLSDGTGNSAAKLFKTNVWRLYQAVDINPPKTSNEPGQVACYDDGVGTENFKPLAYLGLAVGVGLAKNVKDLYTFLCRNYSEGDNIFMFGFSRGAFTVRVLAGMIVRCGLIHAHNEEELRDQVQLVYSEYKKDVARRAANAGRAKLSRLWLRGHKRAAELKFVPLGKKITQRFPRIAFLGVWDTVDAYGMPVDEIKVGIDRFVYPMTLADRDLSPLVERACQALSLDDERPTFRPVLWNEVKKDAQGNEKPVSEAQLTQIWFAGVHANIGGGYPDDGLSLVALQWMMDEAQQQGLWYYDLLRKAVDSGANWHGKQYDSRSGLAGYYRYGPRNVDQLCDDQEHGVRVKTPKVHAAAVDRIGRWEVDYAPVSFPGNYVVMTPGTDSQKRLETKPPPAKDNIQQRVADMETAWDAVTRRRIAYFTTVGLTVALIVPPLDSLLTGHISWLVSSAITTVGDWVRSLPGLSGTLPKLEAGIGKGIGYLPGAVGGWSKPFFGWYQQHPLFFLIAASVLAWLFFRKSALLQHEVFMRSDYAWRRVRDAAPGEAPPLPVTNGLVHALRKARWIRATYRFFAGRVVPFLFAVPAALIGLVIAIFYIPTFVRLHLLRRKYRIHDNPEGKGTEAPDIIERKPCSVQSYEPSGPRAPPPNPSTWQASDAVTPVDTAA